MSFNTGQPAARLATPSASTGLDARDGTTGSEVQFGRVAQGDNPADDRELDYKAITIKELCARYIADLNAGLNLQAV